MARNKDIKDKDQKIIDLQEDIQKKDYDLKSYDQRLNNYRLKEDADLATIKGLESEKLHLELSLAENRQLKDQYFEKSEISQQKYQELFDQLNNIQKEIVAVDELKRDRDERIGALRDELD